MGMTTREARIKRKRRIRKKISGSGERPRLSVYRSLNHVYAQVIDDERGVTLASASSREKGFVPADEPKGKLGQAKAVGMTLAKRCQEKGLEQVVLDRNGYLYHGRVQAVADGAREGGLKL